MPEHLERGAARRELVVQTPPAHAGLVALVPGVLTRWHAFHYLGFTANQWKPLEKERKPRLKPLLDAFRTLLTGLHLMRSGQIEANLEQLNAEARLPFLTELIALKRSGREKEPLPEPLGVYRPAYEALLRQLEAAQVTTHLPGEVAPSVQAAVSDWVVRARRGGSSTGSGHWVATAL